MKLKKMLIAKNSALCFVFNWTADIWQQSCHLCYIESYNENGKLEADAFISACDTKKTWKKTLTILKPALSYLELTEEERIVISFCCLLFN